MARRETNSLEEGFKAVLAGTTNDSLVTYIHDKVVVGFTETSVDLEFHDKIIKLPLDIIKETVLSKKYDLNIEELKIVTTKNIYSFYLVN